MPTLANTSLYAMYVIGQVESDHNWGAVYRVDPITIGMMQEYGQNASNLLKMLRTGDPEGYAAFKAAAPQLDADVDAHGDSWNWWTSRYLTDSEANAWVEFAKRDANHKTQQEKWFDQFQNEYVPALEKFGLSQDRPQTLVFAACMYHQSPRSAGQVIRSCGGNATLETMRNTVLNNGVLGKYKNRYNTTYNMLKDWDGNSAPPDFGQVGDVESGGDSPTESEQQASQISYCQLVNNELVIFGLSGFENGLVCQKMGPNIWAPSANVNGHPNSTDNATTDQGNDTGSDAARKVVELYKSWEGKFQYSQGAGRLDPVNSGVGDCSSTIYAAYKQITGINVGTWTGDMSSKGTLITHGKGKNLPFDQMQLADLVLISWGGSSDESGVGHVELYVGNGQIMGHGGGSHPKGPWLKTDPSNYLTNKCTWWIRRYL